MSVRPLFGGAITATLPERFVDISQLREVPDHQEVFADTETEESIIVELLELEANVPNESCAMYHFQQIAEHNEALQTEIMAQNALTAADIPNLPPDTIGYVLVGDQKVTKFREQSVEAANTVRLFLAVLRLPRVATDLLVTVNVPVVVGEASSSRQIWGAGDVTTGLEHFRTLVGSLAVHNWGLFN